MIFSLEPGQRTAVVQILREEAAAIREAARGGRAARQPAALRTQEEIERMARLSDTDALWLIALAGGLGRCPTEVFSAYALEITQEAGVTPFEAKVFLCSDAGHAAFVSRGARDPGWLTLLRKIRSQLPGPAAREPFLTRFAECIAVWHDLEGRRNGSVTLDPALAAELGLAESASDTRLPTTSVGSAPVMQELLDGQWAHASCLSTTRPTLVNPLSIEIVPNGMTDDDGGRWIVRLSWRSSVRAPLLRVEHYPAEQKEPWGYLQLMEDGDDA